MTAIFNCVQLDSPDNTGSLGSPHWEGRMTRRGSFYPAEICNAKRLYLSQPNGSPSCRGHRVISADRRYRACFRCLTCPEASPTGVSAMVRWNVEIEILPRASPGDGERGFFEMAHSGKWDNPSGRSSLCGHARGEGYVPRGELQEVAKNDSWPPKLCSTKWHCAAKPLGYLQMLRSLGFRKSGYSCDLYLWQPQGYYKCRN